MHPSPMGKSAGPSRPSLRFSNCVEPFLADAYTSVDAFDFSLYNFECSTQFFDLSFDGLPMFFEKRAARGCRIIAFTGERSVTLERLYRQSRCAHAYDEFKPHHVLLTVSAMTAACSLYWRCQADALIVTQRIFREIEPLRSLTDAQAFVCGNHTAILKPGVRSKSRASNNKRKIGVT